MRELDVIDRLRAAFPDCGIGDDAAVLPSVEGELLFAADAAVEGVHFDRRFSTLSQAVQKLVTSNVSDIFAMGGSPGSIVFTAALPAGCSPADVDAIIDGLRRSCTQYGIKLVGGDTVSSPHGFCFNVAIVGEVRPGRAVLRSGARAGDALVLFGEIGLSRAGLSVLASVYGTGAGESALGQGAVPLACSLDESASSLKRMIPLVSIASSPRELDWVAGAVGWHPCADDIARFVLRHLVPLALPLDASLLGADPATVTAMIDISDGLGKDLRTLCAESGVGAVIREEALPIPPAIGALCGLEGKALVDFALSSGEEYVLLAAAAPEAAARLSASAAAARLGAGATVIGEAVREGEGIMLVGRGGKKRPMPKLGYEHEF